MKRPPRLAILEYALQGAQTERGIWSGAMTEEAEAELDADIEWLEAEISRVKALQETAK